MKTPVPVFLRPSFGIVFLLGSMLAPPIHAQLLTREFALLPGWNAVWIDVDPPNRDPSVVFAGLPLASAWTWSERVSATDFIQNPESTGWNRAQWLAYFPSDGPEAHLANLYAILPQRAYLIRLAGAHAVTWSVSGRPTHKTPPWLPDRFNLRGFPVADAGAPTFRQFFRPSAAHFDAQNNRLESIFRLGPDGHWRAVVPDDAMRRGEAYWVYTRGASDYVAPFSLALNSGETIAFDGVPRRVELTLHNALAAPKTIRLEPAGPHASPLLLLPPPVPGQTNLPRAFETHDQPVNRSGAHRLVLGLDRSALADSPATEPATGVHATLLRISDGEGTEFHLAVNALAATALDYTGLWWGTISITNVTPVVGTNPPPDVSGPVAVAFPQRLLVHVDDGGQVSLLRDVTLVYARSQGTNAGVTPDTLRATELVTDPSRLLGYAADDIRSRAVRGRRLTAPHFEFARTNGQFVLPLAGTFGVSNVLTGTLDLPGDHVGNPFLHRYHPDHGSNTVAVSRDVRLWVAGGSDTTSGEGSETLVGTYEETLSGLHKLPLHVSGSLQLRRISDLGRLNSHSSP